jgi:hypothetical protein
MDYALRTPQGACFPDRTARMERNGEMGKGESSFQQARRIAKSMKPDVDPPTGKFGVVLIPERQCGDDVDIYGWLKKRAIGSGAPTDHTVIFGGGGNTEPTGGDGDVTVYGWMKKQGPKPKPKKRKKK